MPWRETATLIRTHRTAKGLEREPAQTHELRHPIAWIRHSKLSINTLSISLLHRRRPPARFEGAELAALALRYGSAFQGSTHDIAKWKGS